MAYFYAQRHTNYGTTNTPIQFDFLVTNIGSGMNNQTGIYTAPTSGP